VEKIYCRKVRRPSQSSWLIGTLLLGLLIAAVPASAAEKARWMRNPLMISLEIPRQLLTTCSEIEQSKLRLNHSGQIDRGAPAISAPVSSTLGQTPDNAKRPTAEPQLTGFYQNDLAYTYADKSIGPDLVIPWTLLRRVGQRRGSVEAGRSDKLRPNL